MNRLEWRGVEIFPFKFVMEAKRIAADARSIRLIVSEPHRRVFMMWNVVAAVADAPR